MVVVEAFNVLSSERLSGNDTWYHSTAGHRYKG